MDGNGPLSRTWLLPLDRGRANHSSTVTTKEWLVYLETKPSTESRFIQQHKLSTESRFIQQHKLSTESRFIQQHRPSTESKFIQQHKPSTESRFIQQHKPSTESRFIQQHKPLINQEQIYHAEIETRCQSKCEDSFVFVTEDMEWLHQDLTKPNTVPYATNLKSRVHVVYRVCLFWIMTLYIKVLGIEPDM